MKILFVGAFNDPWSTHHPFVKVLRNKDHEVIKFDFRNLALKNIKLKFRLYSEVFKEYFETYIMYRLYLPNFIRNFKFYLFGNWQMNRQLLKIIKKNHFDLVLIAKGDTVNYNLIPIFNKFSKTWYFFMDPLNISHEIRAHKYAALCNWCSATTTAMTTLFKRMSKNSYYILEGYDVNIFNPGVNNSNKEIDVIFVGTIDSVREKFITYLRKNKVNVICYGVGWKNKPIYLKDLIKRYRQSKIILNFPKKDSGFSDRVFQALGTGSFLLSKYCSDLRRLFKKGVHLDWFNTPKECLELIKCYLNNDNLREEIAQRGHEFALENFAWDKTVDKILQNINKKL